MAYALVVAPLLFALLAFAVPSNRLLPWVVTLGAATHLTLTILALRTPIVGGLNGWLLLDRLGRLVLGLTSVLFFACGVYLPGYLSVRKERPNRVFCACMLLFMATLTLVAESHHLGLMWVAIEATTLSTAPML